VTMTDERYDVPGPVQLARAAIAWFRDIRRQRFARTMTRNVRWVTEARQTPPVWTEYESDSPDRGSRLIRVG
jgi:hypothetical protein